MVWRERKAAVTHGGLAAGGGERSITLCDGKKTLYLLVGAARLPVVPLGAPPRKYPDPHRDAQVFPAEHTLPFLAIQKVRFRIPTVPLLQRVLCGGGVGLENKWSWRRWSQQRRFRPVVVLVAAPVLGASATAAELHRTTFEEA